MAIWRASDEAAARRPLRQIAAAGPLGVVLDGLALQMIERQPHGGERRDADDEGALDAVGMEDGPIQRLHAADGAAEDQAQAADAERIEQSGLGADVVADGDERESPARRFRRSRD